MSEILEKKDLEKKNKLLKLSNEIKNGSLIIYPTDTVYGLGASIFHKSSLDKIYSVKERDNNSPLIALLSDERHLEKIAIINKKNREKIEKLIKAFWPGGLTIILEKTDIIPSNMVSNGSSVGVRIPDLEISQKLIESCGGILATTSANISGELTPRSYLELGEVIKERVELIVKYNKELKGKESTIIDMRGTPKILRKGHITQLEIEKIIGKVK